MLFQRLREALERQNLGKILGARGGVHLLCETQVGVEAVLSYAHLVVDSGEQWRWPMPPDTLEQLPQTIPQAKVVLEWYWKGQEFSISTHGGLWPIRWSHVLANEQFGWLADDAGTGHLWYGNSHENRLTPWQNDPLADHGPERLMLVGRQSRFSLFAARDGWETQVTYGAGYAVWEKSAGAVTTTLTAFVPVDCPARVFLLRIQGGKRLKLHWSVTGQLSDREEQTRFLRAEAKGNGLHLTNPANTLFPHQTAVFLVSQPCTVTGKQPFLLACPAEERMVFIAGGYQTEQEWERIGSLLDWKTAEAALERTKRWWREKTLPMEIQTPEPALNHYCNGWALYQLIACRMFARAGLYQCGGGYGFRDQLQDICALIPTAPELARAQILRCCAHQFEEGDVQHWWHPEGTDRPERGVRTRISDDLLWLPYAVCQWFRVWGEDDLLREEVPYLRSPVLEHQERERYERPERSERIGSVYEHGTAAIELVLARGVGEHGLCRMGTGDWNDGMNEMGVKGWGRASG